MIELADSAQFTQLGMEDIWLEFCICRQTYHWQFSRAVEICRWQRRKWDTEVCRHWSSRHFLQMVQRGKGDTWAQSWPHSRQISDLPAEPGPPHLAVCPEGGGRGDAGLRALPLPSCQYLGLQQTPNNTECHFQARLTHKTGGSRHDLQFRDSLLEGGLWRGLPTVL